MPSQKIARIRSVPIAQIPRVSFDTGAAEGALGLARMFDGIANRMAVREDKIATRQASRAGALAGSKGSFVRQDEATLVGEAFNTAALQTFSQNIDAKVKLKHAELETKFARNGPAYAQAMNAFNKGVLTDVQKVSPELAPVFAASMQLRQQQGTARINRTMRADAADKLKASSLTMVRALDEQVTDAARFLDTGDIGSTTEFFGTVMQARAQLRVALAATGPNGRVLIGEEDRVKMVQAFDDRATGAALVGAFNQAVARNQRGEDGPDPAALIEAFQNGENLKFEVTGEDGEPVMRTLEVRDELRTKIVSRMRSSLKAARAEATFQRVTEDRERNKAQTEANALLDLGISRNQVREPDVDAAAERGDITVAQRVARLQQIDNRDAALAKRQGQIEKVAAARDAMVKRVAGAGALGFFDPAVKEDREAVDAYFEDVVAPAVAQGDPGAASTTISDYITRVGIVPTEVKSGITAALRQGPAGDRENADQIVQAKIDAADMLGRLAVSTPTVMNEFTTDEKDLGIGIQTLVQAGVDPVEAVRRTEELLAVPESKRNLLEKIARDGDHFEKNQIFIDTTFKTGGTFLFGFGSPDTVVGIAFRAEFNELQRRAFLRTGNLQISQNSAATDMRQVWGPSAVGNGADADAPRMMKYAPERYGNYSNAGDNTEWMREQFVADVLSLNPLLGPDTAPVEQQYRIAADSTTAREAGAKQVPSYAIIFIGNGAPEPVRDRDGDLARWTPDWSKSRQFRERKKAQKEAMDAAREDRKVNSDTNAAIRQTLDSIKGMRDALGVNRTGPDIGVLD